MESSCPFSPQDEGPGRLTEMPPWVMVACRSARVRSTSGTSARTARCESTCALLAAPVCCEDVCATTARGVLGGVCARRKCAQEPAAPVRSGTSGISAAKNSPRELRGAGGQCAQHQRFAPQARDLPMGRVLVPRHGSIKKSFLMMMISGFYSQNGRGPTPKCSR